VSSYGLTLLLLRQILNKDFRTIARTASSVEPNSILQMRADMKACKGFGSRASTIQSRSGAKKCQKGSPSTADQICEMTTITVHRIRRVCLKSNPGQITLPDAGTSFLGFPFAPAKSLKLRKTLRS